MYSFLVQTQRMLRRRETTALWRFAPHQTAT